jgi:hypothetical protein
MRFKSQYKHLVQLQDSLRKTLKEQLLSKPKLNVKPLLNKARMVRNLRRASLLGQQLRRSKRN